MLLLLLLLLLLLMMMIANGWAVVPAAHLVSQHLTEVSQSLLLVNHVLLELGPEPVRGHGDPRLTTQLLSEAWRHASSDEHLVRKVPCQIDTSLERYLVR